VHPEKRRRKSTIYAIILLGADLFLNGPQLVKFCPLAELRLTVGLTQFVSLRSQTASSRRMLCVILEKHLNDE